MSPPMTERPPNQMIGRDPKGRNELNDRRQGSHELGTFHIGVEIGLVLLIEAGNFIGFTDKTLHNTRSSQGFLQDRRNIRRCLLDTVAALANLLAKEIHEEKNHWESAERKKGQLPVKVDHGADAPDKDTRFRDDFNGIGHHGTLEGCHVVCDIAHDGTQLIRV